MHASVFVCIHCCLCGVIKLRGPGQSKVGEAQGLQADTMEEGVLRPWILPVMISTLPLHRLLFPVTSILSQNYISYGFVFVCLFVFKVLGTL